MGAVEGPYQRPTLVVWRRLGAGVALGDGSIAVHAALHKKTQTG